MTFDQELSTTALLRRRIFFRRFIPFLVIASLSTLIIFSILRNRRQSWHDVPHILGLGERYGPTEEQIRSGQNILPDLRSNYSRFREPQVVNTSPYPVGETKPAGSTYTKCLVIARMQGENTSWVKNELGDMMQSGLLTTAIYTVDDPKAKLRPPKNKGHEVMVYLTFIIDNYENLSDVSIFMHAHQFAWHNSELLETDAALMVRHLSPERVTREGYMNLRCEWVPGCPDWLHPENTKEDPGKQEEVILARSWSQLFPLDPVPTVLAQPCCAQFAVSRERILKTPKMRYIYMRDWLLRTDLFDYLSGRIFEYTWQFIFNKAPVYCPSMSACYCDGYGMCFGEPEDFDYWFELRFRRNELKEQLRVWQEKASLVDEWHEYAKGGKMVEEALLDVPEQGKDEELKRRIKELNDEMDERRRKAFELGKDPKQRAKESNRKWKKGHGY